MKVRDIANNPSGIPIPVKEERTVAAGEKPDFKSQLIKAEDAGYEQRLEELVDSIVLQGEKLGEKVDVREFLVYKRLVSEFLELALGKSRKFSKHSLLDRRGRHKVYAFVRKINSELEQLTQDVMEGEKNNLQILQRLDDIRGLILDMAL